MAEHIDDTDICDECDRRHASVACPCHCGDPVDTSEFRNRGMCTHCDDVRCDAYPGGCGRA